MPRPAHQVAKSETPYERLRKTVLRALHAEATKRGLTHDDLRDDARERFNVTSMSELNAGQLKEFYHAMTGTHFLARTKHPGIRGARRRQAAGTAGRKGDASNVAELADPHDVQMVHDYAQQLGWENPTLLKFITRQLGGREQIRTVADCNKVLWALKGIWRRRGKGTGGGLRDSGGGQ